MRRGRERLCLLFKGRPGAYELIRAALSVKSMSLEEMHSAVGLGISNYRTKAAWKAAIDHLDDLPAAAPAPAPARGATAAGTRPPPAIIKEALKDADRNASRAIIHRPVAEVRTPAPPRMVE